MSRFDAAIRTKCVALIAVATLHLLILAALGNTPSPRPAQSRPQNRLLTVMLLPAESRQPLQSNVPEKRDRAAPSLLGKGKAPAALKRSGLSTEPARGASSTEEQARDQATTKVTANSAERAGSSSDVGLGQQPMDWKSNAGAVDQRWLLRDWGSLQSGAAKPDLRARTNQERFEQTMSRSARGDCRTKYAHLGLLAVPFLVSDTASDIGCKW
jgi:hypothetical protein